MAKNVYDLIDRARELVHAMDEVVNEANEGRLSWFEGGREVTIQSMERMVREVDRFERDPDEVVA